MLLSRGPAKQIVNVDWVTLLMRWSTDYGVITAVAVNGIVTVFPPQAVVDLFTGHGRGPQEVEALLLQMRDTLSE
jgi:hypothetical protein